jgi:hypothetical protein
MINEEFVKVIKETVSSINIADKEFDTIYWLRNITGKDYLLYFKENVQVKTGLIEGFNNILIFAKKLIGTTFIFKVSFDCYHSDRVSIHLCGDITNFKNDLISCLEEDHVVGDCNIYENFVIYKTNEYICRAEAIITITKIKS